MADPKAERSDLEAGSRRKPSTTLDFVDGKKGGEAAVAKTDQGKGEEAEPTARDQVAKSEKYPTGARLAFIIVALVLSMFLVALDIVSPSPCSRLRLSEADPL